MPCEPSNAGAECEEGVRLLECRTRTSSATSRPFLPGDSVASRSENRFVRVFLANLQKRRNRSSSRASCLRQVNDAFGPRLGAARKNPGGPPGCHVCFLNLRSRVMKLFVGSLFAFVVSAALVGCGETKPTPAPPITPSPETMKQHAAGDPAAATDAAAPAADAAAPAADAAAPSADAAAPAADAAKPEEKKEEAAKPEEKKE